MFNSPFNASPISTLTIEPEAEIVFVADLFVDDYVGGAELTSEALIKASPFKVQKIHSKEVTVDLLAQGYEKYWIFGNFAGLQPDLIPSIVANLNYSVLEYDYKYCKYRSPDKHKFAENEDCDCHTQMTGKMVSAFYYGAKSLWWMSEKQQERYHSHFPFLGEKENTVLSSVFDDDYFALLKILTEKYKNQKKKGWIVLGSSSWIKGADQAEQWCKDHQKEYEVVWDLPHEDVLEKLAQAKGFVYLPQGGDTCPRMVIEAKMLGCELHINDFVEHAKEIWFETEDPFDTEAYLYAARERFWSSVKDSMNYSPSISSYTTTKDCINQNYPWRACINSALGFSDEVVVVDGGSTDGTWEELETWASKEEKLKVYKVERDWSHKRHAVFDGAQKAEARSRCTSEFLWQIDCDEVVHEDDFKKIKNLCAHFPQQADLVSLPVIEYWGGPEKVRMDINPWKWRLSRNKPYITHGIPVELRKYDDNGDLYSEMGTDGCDYVHSETGTRIPHASFYSGEVDQVRRAALSGDKKLIEKYQEWYNNAVNQLPGVHHYSWFNIERKILTYKNYWQRHWESLYDVKQEDTPENNMFFDKSWKDVTNPEIKNFAKDLAEKTGGHIFHSKVNLDSPTPHVELNRGHPKAYLDID